MRTEVDIAVAVDDTAKPTDEEIQEFNNFSSKFKRIQIIRTLSKALHKSRGTHASCRRGQQGLRSRGGCCFDGRW